MRIIWPHQILTTFGIMDPLSRIELFFAYGKHGKLHKFTVMNLPNYFVESVLRRYRISCYGRSMCIRNGNEFRSFHVNARQARWAEYVMLRAGVPLVGGLIDPRNAAAADKEELPPQWQEGKATTTPIEWLTDVMAKFDGLDPEARKRR